MTALGVAKALLCKNRFDSFTGAEGESGDGAMICKWRADSFAAAAQAQAEGVMPREHTNTELEMQRHGPSGQRATLQAHVEPRRSGPDNRQREAAYLEALAQQRGELPPSPTAVGPPPGRRRQKGGICAGDSEDPRPPEQERGECRDRSMDARLEAMEMAASQAAIRERLEQEMQNACSSSSSSFSALQPQPIMTQASSSPARARRGSSQPGQLSGRRSSRSSLNLQQPKQGQALVATAIAGVGLQRTSSFDNSSFRHTADKVKAAATETFLTAESFRQAAMSPRHQRSESFHSPRVRRTSTFGRIESFGAPASPMPRTSSFGQLFTASLPQALPQADWQRPASPCTSRSSSFSVRSGNVVLSRSNSLAMMPPSSSFAPVAVPNAAAIQRAAAMVEEQAQLAARLNIASEMIDSLVMDSSVLDEAKRLTDAVARKQQQRRQQQQRHASPSPHPPSSYAAVPKQTPKRPASRDSLFWRPPPEAARLCARCPSFDTLPANRQANAMGRTPSVDLSRMAPVGTRRSFVSPRAK